MKKIIDPIKIVAFILGGLGLIYTLYVHINAIDYADISEGERIPSIINTLIWGVWIVAIITIIMRQQDLKAQDPNFKMNPVKFYKILFNGTPIFMVAISVASFLYGNFYGLFIHETLGITGIIDGKLVLHNHGQIIKELTNDEFLKYKADEIKMTTATIMVFYGVGTGILYPQKNKSTTP